MRDPLRGQHDWLDKMLRFYPTMEEFFVRLAVARQVDGTMTDVKWAGIEVKYPPIVYLLQSIYADPEMSFEKFRQLCESWCSH